MAIAETAKLVVDLSLKGNFSSAMAANQKALSSFTARVTDTQGRAYKAGQQIGTGIQNTARLAIVGISALVPALVLMAKEGQAAANVQTIFAKSIQNSGKVSLANVAALNAQQAALLALGGVDDELIKTEQTRLIQMGLTGDQVLKLTPLILDFSKATGVDLLTATKLAGKSVEGNTGALSRYGVAVDKAKAKTDPFGATMDALGKKFGGTTQALSGSLNTRLDVLRERLANVREEAGIKLLPVFTRIVTVVGDRLVPAFGKLIDAILPKAIAGLNKFADFLDRGGGADSVMRIVDTIQAVLPAITAGAKITGQIIGTAVRLFESLPPEIQSLAIAGLAVNKLTGGLVTNLAGGLIDTVVHKLFSSLSSAVVNVNGAVVNVSGAGIPGGPAAPVSPTGGIGTVGKVFLAAESIAAIGAVIATQQSVSGQNSGLATGVAGSVSNEITGGASLADLQKSLAAVDQGIADINNVPFNVLVSGDALDQLKLQDASLRAALDVLKRGYPLMTGTERNTGKAADDIAGTIVAIGQAGNQLVGRLDSLHASFKTDLRALITATKAADIAKAAKRIAAEIAKGVGNAKNTSGVLADLKLKLTQTDDPKTRAILKAAIDKVQAKIPGREFVQRQIVKADALLKDGKVTRADLKTIAGIEKALKDRGLPSAAKAIEAKVEAARKAQVHAANLTTAAADRTKAAIDRKHLSVTVNSAITIRDVNRTITKFSRYSSVQS